MILWSVFSLLFCLLIGLIGVNGKETLHLRRSMIVQADKVDVVATRRVFVMYPQNRQTEFEQHLEQMETKAKIHYHFKDLSSFVLTLPVQEIEKLKDSENVLVIQDDVPRYPHFIKNDNLSTILDGAQRVPYGVKMVQAPALWDIGATGEGVKVCVIDTGVDALHNDLYHATQFNNDDDDVGHGTHCAGTIAAANNAIGVVGVAPQAQVISVKVFSDNGAPAHSSEILAAARNCAQNGTDIVNLSLGGPDPNPIESLGFKQLFEKRGIISVAAAGNLGNSDWSFPASHDGVLSVGAVYENKTLAPFSQHNPHIDFVAPGVQVLSTLPTKAPCIICDMRGFGYGYLSGTSMAAPHVAGSLALLKSFKPSASPTKLVEALRETAKDLGATGKDVQYGNGLIQTVGAAQHLSTYHGHENADGAAITTHPRCSGEQKTYFQLQYLNGGPIRWTLRHRTTGKVELDGGSSVKECIPANCYIFSIFQNAENAKGYKYSLTIDDTVITHEDDMNNYQFFGSCTNLILQPKSPPTEAFWE